MRTRRVTFTGTVLARLFAAVFEENTPFDGLLFGAECSHVVDVCNDQQESHVSEETVLMVTNVILSVEVCSFYDGAGKINNEKLAGMAARCNDPVIGWCSFSLASQRPSVAQHRVTHSLTSHPLFHTTAVLTLPRLFCLLYRSKDHHDATITLKYDAYLSVEEKEYPELTEKMEVSQGRMLIPVPVQILNTGDNRGSDCYSSFFPGSFGFLSGCEASPRSPEMLISKVENVYLESQDIHIRLLEQQCFDLRKEFEKQVADVKAGTQEVHQKKEQLDRLKLFYGQQSR